MSEEPANTDGATVEVLPRKFGKYTLLRRLATGGMAELYLALHRSIAGFERIVVIKRILPELGKDQNFITMLLQEARIAATFSHPNIVTIFDVGQVDGTYFIAMEHIHGEDLRSVVRSMKPKGQMEFPLEHAVNIAQGVAAGLAYAHDKQDMYGNPLNIVHRDVSPQNVLVTFTGDVKVVDFGIAKATLARPVQPRGAVVDGPTRGSDPGVSETSEHSTRVGQLKGKIPYMSPEQARGEPLDPRSDVFSLGIILFELSTGRRLFRGPSEIETLRMITDGLYPRPSEVNPRVSRALERVIMRALSPRRDDRYQSAREFQSDLVDVAHAERIPVSSVSLGQWMSMLFEERLAAQREALAEGKQLADVLAIEDAVDDSGTGITSIGATTPVQAQSRRPLHIALGVLVLVTSLAVGLSVRQSHRVAEAARVQAEVRSGTILVHSSPEGAHIWLNDAPTEFRTPHELRGLSTGSGVRYRVRLSAEGYDPATEEVLLPRARARRAVSLSLVRVRASSFAVLEVSTAPRGARVLVDGRALTGATPLVASELEPGVEHRVLVQLTDYTDEVFTFVGAAGDVVNRALILRERPLGHGEAFIDVVTVPTTALLRIDERELTTGSPYHLRVTGGQNHTVTVSAPGYRSETRLTHPAAGRTLALGSLELDREHERPAVVDSAPGRLTVDARPWCNITVDGSGRGQTPVVNLSLSPGHHTINCTNPQRGTETRRIDLNPRQDLRVRIVFP